MNADGQRYFTGVRDIVSRVQKQFSKLGSVDVVNVFKDAQGDIQSFTASVTKADGVVERFNFNLAKIRMVQETIAALYRTIPFYQIRTPEQIYSVLLII